MPMQNYPLRMPPELRAEMEGLLEDGETRQDFILEALRQRIAQRKGELESGLRGNLEEIKRRVAAMEKMIEEIEGGE